MMTIKSVDFNGWARWIIAGLLAGGLSYGATSSRLSGLETRASEDRADLRKAIDTLAMQTANLDRERIRGEEQRQQLKVSMEAVREDIKLLRRELLVRRQP